MFNCLRLSLILATLLLCSPIWAASLSLPETEIAKSITARGVLRARQNADIAAPIFGKLLSAPYAMGQFFSKGDALATFDCRHLNAELLALRQKLETQNVKYETLSELQQHGAAGKLEVARAKSERDYTEAEADILKAKIQDCTVSAPFNGFVTARHANAFEMPQAGQILYSVQRAATPELSIILPSSWTSRVKAGQLFDFTVDETGEKIIAKVLRKSVNVDPVSQTFEITARPQKKPIALAGMSGVAHFKTEP